MRAQFGQSLVEFAIGSAALLLLLLGVITLSGFQEVERRGSGAARMVAFESAWQPLGASPQESSQRVFAQHYDDSALLDAVGRARYVMPGDVSVSRGSGPAPGLAAEATTLLLAPLRASEAFVGGNIDLESGGYVSGHVAAHLAPHRWLPEPFDSLDLSLQQQYAILTDSWNGSGPRHVRERTASLIPTQSLSSITAIWRGLAAPLSIVEPSIDKLCLGLIEPDAIPEDRLGPVVNSMRIRRPCR